MIQYIKELICRIFGHDYVKGRQVENYKFEWKCKRCGNICKV